MLNSNGEPDMPTDIHFDKDGLIPVIVQEETTNDVLLLAFMNEEALRRTMETGLVHFWSRSRQKLWQKGETSGHVQERAYRFAYVTGIATVALIGLVSLWTPFLDAAYMQRWFAWPQILFVAPVPAMVAVAAWQLLLGLRRRHELRPFLAALAMFLLCFVGLSISFYPYLVPTSVTLWEAAAPDKSLGFLLVGAAVLIPLIIGYSAYSYWVFRGKVDTAGGYH